MTNNSKIGLGVGMLAVFATFAIASYGPQTSKVASISSNNNSAAALSTQRAESVIKIDSLPSEDKNYNAAGRLINTPTSSAPSCAKVSVSTLPLSQTSFNDGDASADIFKMRIKNTGSCDFYLTGFSLANLSFTGSWNFAKAYLFDAITGQQIPTSFSRPKNTFMNDTTIYFGGGANNAVVMKILAPNQSLDVRVQGNYIRNTFLIESPTPSPGSLGIKDYFTIGVDSVTGFDTNMVAPTINFIQKFDKVITVQ